MISAKLAGAALLALPSLTIATIVLWRRQRAVFWFCCALILVGTGYLAVTGATDDIAKSLVPGLLAR